MFLDIVLIRVFGMNEISNDTAYVQEALETLSLGCLFVLWTSQTKQ